MNSTTSVSGYPLSDSTSISSVSGWWFSWLRQRRNMVTISFLSSSYSLSCFLASSVKILLFNCHQISNSTQLSGASYTSARGFPTRRRSGVYWFCFLEREVFTMTSNCSNRSLFCCYNSWFCSLKASMRDFTDASFFLSESSVANYYNSARWQERLYWVE